MWTYVLRHHARLAVIYRYSGDGSGLRSAIREGVGPVRPILDPEAMNLPHPPR